MSALNFMYIAFGGGFILLVIFLCVLLLHVTLILRDINKVTGNIKDTSKKINSYIIEPAELFQSLAGQFSFLKGFADKFKQKFEEEVESETEETEKDTKDSGKKFFRKRKVR